MKKIYATSQFKKDFKKIKTDLKKVEKLFQIIKLIENGEKIPPQFKPHPLKGALKNCLECHIENDLLLIWCEEDSDIIKLIRIGSHTELFE